MVRSSLAGRTVGEDSISTILPRVTVKPRIANAPCSTIELTLMTSPIAVSLGYAAVGGAAVVIGAGYASVARSMTRRIRSLTWRIRDRLPDPGELLCEAHETDTGPLEVAVLFGAFIPFFLIGVAAS